MEGTLTRWLKKPGEKVERDEPLFEISTDKVDTEIPAPVAGVLSEVLVQEGATVAIKTIVARIGDGASSSDSPEAAPAPATQESAPPVSTPPSTGVGPSAAVPENRTYSQPPPQAPSPQPPSPQQQPTPEPVAASAGPYPIEPPPQPSAGQTASPNKQASTPPPPQPTAQSDGVEDQGPLSPLVRKMAREYNIDLSQIKGSGAGGRISKQDVEAYMSSQAAKTYEAPQPQAAAASVVAKAAEPAAHAFGGIGASPH